MVADDDFRGRNFEKTDGGGAGKILCELTDDSNYLADRWRVFFYYFSVLSSGGKVAFYDRQWAMWRV